MSRFYARVAQRAGHRCEYCHAPEAIFNFHFEVEHVLPVSQHGPDEEANLALSCRSCNLRKSDHQMGLDDVTQAEARLFNPREDNWDSHFQVNHSTGEIVGLSPIGRATVSRLQLNGMTQLEARRYWMRLAIFPSVLALKAKAVKHCTLDDTASFSIVSYALSTAGRSIMDKLARRHLFRVI